MKTPSRRTILLALSGAAAATLTACNGSKSAEDARGVQSAPATTPAPTPPSITVGLNDGATGVKITPSISVASDGQLGEVKVTDAAGAPVAGAMGDAGWSPAAPLAFGQSYTLTATASGQAPATKTVTFTTLSPAALVTADLNPYSMDQVRGVGMPVVLTMSKPVPKELRQELVRRSVVTNSAGPVEGAWRWFSATELHYRPREYWPANTTVRVQIDLSNLDLGDGVWGGDSRDVSFRIGDSKIATANADTHQMEVKVNGELVQTFPISCGREDQDIRYVTRSGPHMVLENGYRNYTMSGESAGFGPGSYTTEVEYAVRISNSGEFTHAAPWNSSIGKANKSHGCINMRTPDARWVYDNFTIGDIVDVVGTDRPLNLGNGLNDWAVSWEEWTAE